MADDKKDSNNRDVFVLNESVNFPVFKVNQPTPRMEITSKPPEPPPPATKPDTKK